MALDMVALADDLAAETAVLRAMLAGLDDDGWEAPTPAVGWAIRDQVSHLAHYDEAALRSATEPEAFAAEASLDPDSVAEAHRALAPAELLAWFDSARARLLDVFRGLDPGLRVPWYGPPLSELASEASTQRLARSADRAQRGNAMSTASALTARIMETWAHGQDVADTLGVRREPTDRLRHVAHIGVRALPFSFAVHGREVPAAPVRVELTSPGGDLWVWGPEGAADRVAGPALDFCLLVTQRRHRDDLELRASGPVAAEWLRMAQAYAGPPGQGRRPRTP